MKALEDQFYVSKLVGKLLNVSTEIESKAFYSEVFKAVVSGDKIGASFKHQTPFDFQPFCKLAFSSNRHPRILDNSEGFFRKIIVVEMNNRFEARGKADLYLEEKLYSELSGIFAWALEGLNLLRKEGFKKPPTLAKALMDYKRSNNPIQCFMEDCLEIAEGVQTTKKELYDAYKSYIRQWGYGQAGATTFGRELHNLIPGLGYSRRPLPPREWCYVGVKLIDGSAPDASPHSPSFDDSPLDKERKSPF
jgi:putative DNA primase/helicase